MTRGDFVTVAMQGDFGKPRPALVIQADAFSAHASVTVLPVSSQIVAAPLLRITVEPNAENGLKKPSQVMVDTIAVFLPSPAKRFTRATMPCQSLCPKGVYSSMMSASAMRFALRKPRRMRFVVRG